MTNKAIISKAPQGLPLQHNETALFTAYGCTLIEQAGNGRYDYRAVNVRTGRAVGLGNRSERLPASMFATIAAQMEKCAASDRWFLADADSGTAHSKARLMDILHTTFEDILPKHGFVPREKQIELAGEMLDALCGLGIRFAEAEVGIGKTLAYLLSAALVRRGRANRGRINTMSRQHGGERPIVIATSGIALQRAIEQDYIPMLSAILLEHGIISTPLTSALRKGKGNYICEEKLSHFRFFADQSTKDILTPLLAPPVVDLATVKNLTPFMKRNICVDKNCGKNCPKFGKCRYMRHLAEVKRGGYDFQVCNHNYLLADLIHRSKDLSPLLPDYQAVIIDEAHKFTDAARGMYGSEVSLAEIYNIVKDIREFTFGHKQSTATVIREADRILTRSCLLFQFLNKEVPYTRDGEDDAERYPTQIRQKTEKLIRTLKEKVDILAELLGARTVTAKFENRFTAVKRTLRRIGEGLDYFIDHNELIYWLEEGDYAEAIPADSNPRLTILRGIPKNLGGLLYRDLWSMNIPIILTSGTLSAAGSFEHIKRKTGIDLVPVRRISETSKPSPFNHRENMLLYISESTTFPDNKDEGYINSIVSEIERLVTASHGHAAVLFTSYMAMDMVWEQIAARRLPYPLFRLDRGGASVIERFKRSGNGILFASGAMWEGIDIPGDILSMLIIVRLPFAVPDPISEYEQTLYDTFDEFKQFVIVPEMLVKLKQGFGRLIRTESDIGVCAILDSRARTGTPYHDRVLAALPSCRTTSKLDDVREFIKEKKSLEYFEEERHEYIS